MYFKNPPKKLTDFSLSPPHKTWQKIKILRKETGIYMYLEINLTLNMLDSIILNILMISLRRWLIRIILPNNLNLSLNFTYFLFCSKQDNIELFSMYIVYSSSKNLYCKFRNSLGLQ